MALVLKFFRVLRNNWKKTVFISGLTAYGANYTQEKFKDEMIRRVYCEEAQKYGNERILPGHRLRKITVFLNPAAQNGNARKLFEKTAAPLLHLAGLEVTVVKTEYEGQAKKYLSVLEAKDVDGIVVAGGDGTLLEVVTGAMRKGASSNFQQSVPIGVLPLGKTNKMAQILFGTDKKQVRLIADSTMSIIRGLTKKMDVMQVKSEDGRTTYAMSSIDVGVYRDTNLKKTKYWYFGPLKDKWTYIRRTFGQWPPTFAAKLSYLPNSIEVSSIKKKPKVETSPKKKWSWLHLFYKPAAIPSENEDDDYDIDESALHTEDLSTVEFTVASSNFLDNESMKSLAVEIGPSSPSKTEFINEGFRRVKEKSLMPSSDINQKLMTKVIKFVPENTEGMWFSIDGEAFEAMPIEVKLFQKKLNFYCNS